MPCSIKIEVLVLAVHIEKFPLEPHRNGTLVAMKALRYYPALAFAQRLGRKRRHSTLQGLRGFNQMRLWLGPETSNGFRRTHNFPSLQPATMQDTGWKNSWNPAPSLTTPSAPKRTVYSTAFCRADSRSNKDDEEALLS